MRIKLFSLLVPMSLCALLGCAKSNPVESTVAETQPAVNPSPEQPPAVHPKPKQTPAKSLGHVAKTEPAPVSTPKAKSNNNNIAVQQEVAAPRESKAAPKQDEPTPGKPAEMKVANGLDRNPYLASVVRPLVPQHSTLTQAAAGFKNERQFIAALHLSKNLVMPFDQIKIRVTGKHRMSLSDSLRDIRPSLTKNMAKEEANKAEQQAKNDESHAKDEAKKAEKLAKSGNSAVAGNLSNGSSRK